MQKVILIGSLIALLVATPALAYGGGYRHGYYPRHYRAHYYRGHHYRPHYYSHYRHYRHNHSDYWAAWGIGVFTGAVVSHLFYRPPAPTVVYQQPAATVVYQQPAPVVVEKHYVTPTSPPTSSISAGKVTVSVGALNVRRGPGLAHTIATYVRMGEVLEVRATAPGWLYVRTAAGHTGWVMARYTRSLAAPVG